MRHYVDKRSFNYKKIIQMVMLLVILLVPIQANATMIDDEDMEGQSPGIVEKLLSEFVLNVVNGLIGISGAQDVSVLVFQRPEVVDSTAWITNTNSADRSSLVFGLFPESTFNGIASIYDAFANLLPIPMVIILAFAGLLLLLDLLRSSEKRTSLKEYLFGSILAVLFIRFGYMLWDWIIYINYIIVDTIYFLLIDNGITVTSFISTIWDQGSTENIISSANFFIALIVACAAFMTFSINYQYMMRILIVGTLIVLFPIVVICAIIPSRRNTLNQWFTLFTTQIFTQAAHAIALGIFFLILASASDGFAFWLCLAMFFGLPMITDFVQRIIGTALGDSNASGGFGRSIANASGFSAIMGTIALGKTLMKPKGAGAMTGSDSKVAGRDKQQAVNFGETLNPSMNISNDGKGITSANSFNRMNASSTKSRNGIFAKTGQSIGNGASSLARKVANSDSLKQNTKLAMAGAFALGGAAIGTMVTGRANGGAAIGAGTGFVSGKIMGSAIEKGAKATELGGEMLQDISVGNQLFDTTKERLGYHDTSQLADRSEMARMGKELIGGNTGAILGGTVGATNYATSKFSITDPQKYKTVNDRKDLINSTIPQSANDLTQSKARLEEARRNVSIAKSSVILNPKNEAQLKAAQRHEAQMNIEYETRKANHAQLEKKAEQFYERKKLQSDLKELNQVRRSSGKLS